VQWEYACRAGTTGRHYWEDKSIGDYAWYYENTLEEDEEYAHKVGQKRPNTFGLYDMNGNVWEWCLDTWHERYENASSDGSAWIDADQTIRVCRGGSYSDPPRCCSSAYRGKADPEEKESDLGFRVIHIYTKA
jgi:formylglycine-generating enzyme required for sulfatase activity